MAGLSIWNDFIPIRSLIGMISCLMAEFDHEFGVILYLGGRINKGIGETFGLIGRILDLDFDMEMDFIHHDIIHFGLQICNFRNALQDAG